MRLPLSALILAAFVAAPTFAAPPTVDGCQVFPANNYWNTPVDTLPLHPSSFAWTSSIGLASNLHPDWGNVVEDYYGIPFTTVTGAQQLVPVHGIYEDESDPGPYPIPPDAPIEGGPNADPDGDRHVLVIETTNCVLYELYQAFPLNGGTSWDADSFAKWPLTSNALRPLGWTSADAAGLAIFPGLVRYEEAVTGEINHAIRFTASKIWAVENAQHKFLWPARHWSGSSNNPLFPPMGARFRLKKNFQIPANFDPLTQTILRAMKKYGMVLVDGGSNWFFQGVTDTNWPDTVFDQLKTIAGSNFEAVDTSFLQIDVNSAQAVQSTSPPRLFGISTRMQVLTGDDVMIGGFIIDGPTPKTVVMRARGPSTGLQGALVNPTLTIVPSAGGANLVNDDWGTAANAAQLQASGFAPGDPKESAILATLVPGAYTAIVSGVGNTTGIGIVEVYEIDSPGTPQIGISTRGRVLTGNDVMIGGFIIQGDFPQTVVVRARGPSLGIPGVLNDPTLTIVPSAGGANLVNDNWQTAANAAQLQASGFAPAHPNESAILVTLSPGAYTAIVSGMGNTTGVAIVEVYAQ